MIEKKLLTVNETAKTLGTTSHKVYDLIHAGLLPALKLGGYKISIKAIDDFIAASDYKDYTDPFNVISLVKEG